MSPQDCFNEANGVANAFQDMVDKLQTDVDAGADDWQPSVLSEALPILTALVDFTESMQQLAEGGGTTNSADEVDL